MSRLERLYLALEDRVALEQLVELLLAGVDPDEALELVHFPGDPT